MDWVGPRAGAVVMKVSQRQLQPDQDMTNPLPPYPEERCHPDVTRPFTVREYARIQTFPDDWEFQASISSQYKQIGNAVPPLLASVFAQKRLYKPPIPLFIRT